MHQFDEAELSAKAVELGLIADGQALPRHLRSHAAAALVAARQGQPPEAPEAEAGHLVITGDRRVLLDGHALPVLVVDDDPIHVVLQGDAATIRLTIAARTIIVHPEESKSSGQA
ncbi:hypothetical protein ACFY05_42000 [Microtetraspora fusca]|uniref:Uncharacterized protein n=1 Tax=Microtetraspora fusca TaxID=1997 RepID=A0ABW6VNM9_MICFU